MSVSIYAKLKSSAYAKVISLAVMCSDSMMCSMYIRNRIGESASTIYDTTILLILISFVSLAGVFRWYTTFYKNVVYQRKYITFSSSTFF